MTWREFMYTYMEMKNEKIYYNGYIYNNYKESTSYARAEISKKTKSTLLRRLTLIFKELDKKNIASLFEEISEVEAKLYLSLLEYLPRNICSAETNQNVDVYTVLPFDYWEHLPLKQRQIIVNQIEDLKNNENDRIFEKYVFITKQNDREKVFDNIQSQLLYPEYYRLMNNLRQLTEIFSMDYDSLIEKMGMEQFLNFQKDFNDLLRKYEAMPNSLIRGYPRNDIEIDAYIEKIGAPILPDDDFAKYISDCIF